jgi:hypothetical protein
MTTRLFTTYNILEANAPPAVFTTRFDAICISGVLEHVPDFSLFLSRLKPLLQDHGKLYLFRFPNQYSWIEKINDLRLGRATDHPIRFSLKEIHFMLRWHGFRVDDCSYEEIMPVNLTGLPPILVRPYHKLNPLLMAVSKLLYNTPVLNKLSTSFRFTATKPHIVNVAWKTT